MQTFTDIHGRKWTVSVTVATVKRVKARLNIDMLNNIDEFTRLIMDLITLCDILYVVCQTEADERGISDEQFTAGLAGPVLNDAAKALESAYVAFFPDPKVAANVRVLIEKNNVVREKAIALIEAKTPQMIQRIDKEIKTFLDTLEDDLNQNIAGGDSLTSAPASSGSTRRRSRSKS